MPGSFIVSFKMPQFSAYFHEWLFSMMNTIQNQKYFLFSNPPFSFCFFTMFLSTFRKQNHDFLIEELMPIQKIPDEKKSRKLICFFRLKNISLSIFYEKTIEYIIFSWPNILYFVTWSKVGNQIRNSTEWFFCTGLP